MTRAESVQRAVPDQVSVIVLNWNGGDVLLDCLRSLRDQQQTPGEIIVVDNGSSEYSREQVTGIIPTAIQIGLPTNLGYCAGMNAGLARTSREYVWLLNNDVVLSPDATEQMVASWRSSGSEVAALFPKVVYYDRPDRVNACGATFDLWRLWRRDVDGQPSSEITDSPRRVFGDIFVAPCLRRSALLAAGGFDERFFSHSEDIDLSCRLNLMGYQLMTAPRVLVRHRMSHSTRVNVPDRLRLHFRNIRNYTIAVLSAVQARNVPRACVALGLRLWVVGTARAAARFGAGPARLAQAYALGMADLARSIPWLLRRRRAIQRRRRVPDQRLWRR